MFCCGTGIKKCEKHVIEMCCTTDGNRLKLVFLPQITTHEDLIQLVK